MQSSFSQRFSELLDYFKLTTSEVARLTNLKRQTVDNFIKQGNPKYESLVPVLRYFHNVSARWLLLDEGSMFLQGNQELTYANERTLAYTKSEKIEKMWLEDRKELNRIRDLNHSLMEDLARTREQNNSLVDQIRLLSSSSGNNNNSSSPKATT